nr:DUF4062 domain-containing protein [Ornithinimicrobium sp. F0845]
MRGEIRLTASRGTLLDVRVFVSSLISGYESLRAAAAAAIVTLGNEVVRAEDFQASPDSPQQSCLAGVRDSQAVVLLLGERYGHVQQSGLSATHEEYREARESRPVLVFVQRDCHPEPKQVEFIREVQGWEKGHFTAEFSDAEDLRTRVTRALHEFALANEASPLNENELIERARALLPAQDRSHNPILHVGVAPGPVRAVLRPAQLDDPQLQRYLLAEALTGDNAVLTPSAGTDLAVVGDMIRLSQPQVGRFITLDESGRVLIARQAQDDRNERSALPSIIEEDVIASIEGALRFIARLLDYVDQPKRLTYVAPLVSLSNAGYMPWRTRSEQMANPNSMVMGHTSAGDVVVSLTPPVRRRPALVHDAPALAQDFALRIRREIQG